MNEQNVAHGMPVRNGVARRCDATTDNTAAWSGLASVRTDPIIASYLRAWGVSPGDVDRLDVARVGTEARLVLPLVTAHGAIVGLLVHPTERGCQPFALGRGGVLACPLLTRALATGCWPPGATGHLVVVGCPIAFLRWASAAPRGVAVLGVVGRLPVDVAARVPCGADVILRVGGELAGHVAARLRRTCRVRTGGRP